MKKIILPLLLSLSTPALAQTDTTYFSMLCGPCHTVGWGKKVGPDLKDIDKKYSDEQLTAWIKELKMAASDTTSAQLQKMMKTRRMPGFVFVENPDVSAIIAYIKKMSSYNFIGPRPYYDLYYKMNRANSDSISTKKLEKFHKTLMNDSQRNGVFWEFYWLMFGH